MKPVSEESSVDMKPWFLPLNIEIEAVSDGEISVINNKDIADVNFNENEVWLKKM